MPASELTPIEFIQGAYTALNNIGAIPWIVGALIIIVAVTVLNNLVVY